VRFIEVRFFEIFQHRKTSKNAARKVREKKTRVDVRGFDAKLGRFFRALFERHFSTFCDVEKFRKSDFAKVVMRESLKRRKKKTAVMTEVDFDPYFPPRELSIFKHQARGWFKPASIPGEYQPRVSLAFANGSRRRPREFLTFRVTDCQLIEFSTNHRVFEEAPPDTFIFDARTLVEGIEDLRTRSQLNLRALDDAYAWWAQRMRASESRQPHVTFFCYSGQNRSVTAAVFFACSALMELLDGTERWKVVGSVYRPFFDESGEEMESSREYCGDVEDFPGFVLSLIAQIRPEAFCDSISPIRERAEQVAVAAARAGVRETRSSSRDVLRCARRSEALAEVGALAARQLVDLPGRPRFDGKLLDYWTLWRGHDDNRQILRIVDAALRARMYQWCWRGRTWLGRTLPQ
jgi:hypothetical protein